MRIIEASAEIVYHSTNDDVLKKIERIGRVCYKSEERITDESAEKFVSKILQSKHESVIEHVSITVLFIHNRGFTHELVRHRLASYSQQSTRYTNDFILIKPYWADEESMKEERIKNAYDAWMSLMAYSEQEYLRLQNEFLLQKQAARGILPNDIKTEIYITANLREWRHIFAERTSNAAHPDMRRVMIPLKEEMRSLFPIFFN